MKFDVILTTADNLADAFSDVSRDMVRLDGLSDDEMMALADIVSREQNEGILMATLPYNSNGAAVNDETV